METKWILSLKLTMQLTKHLKAKNFSVNFLRLMTQELQAGINQEF